MTRILLILLLLCLPALGGTGTLTDRATGETITASFFNDIHSALDGTLVPRNASGVPTAGQDLGSTTYRWGTVYGAALDTSGAATVSTLTTSGAATIGGALSVNGGATSYVVGLSTSPLTIKSASGNSNGLKLYSNNATDVASIINHYNANLELGANNATVLTLATNGIVTPSVAYESPIFRTVNSNPASAGIVRLAKTDKVAWRNNAAAADLSLDSGGTDTLTLAGGWATTASGAGTATLTNFPAGAATNPDVFINVSYNGTTYIIPAWTP